VTEAVAPREPLPIRVRLAHEDDRDAVLAFASNTWGGQDYIPDAWPHWIRARDGVLLVATPRAVAPGASPHLDANGEPLDADTSIAVCRVALLAEGEAWLEGIRVDPRVRGRSVATQLQVAELTWAAAHGARTVRYATGQDNEGSHRLGARHGFERLPNLRAYRRPEPEEESDDHQPLSYEESRALDEAEDLARLDLLAGLAAAGMTLADDDAADVERWWRRLEADPTFRAGHSLYELRPWAFQPLTRERFAAHAALRQVVARESASGAWGMFVLPRYASHAEDRRLAASATAGDAAVVVELLAEVEARAGRAVRLRFPEPIDPAAAVDPAVTEFAAAFAAAGYEPADRTLHLMGRRIDADLPVPLPDAPELLELADEPRAIATPLPVV
jgi:GNAT superfamily N-acetyltransferase